MAKSWVLVLLVATACGGTEPSPVEKCDDLIDLLCDRAVQCIPTGGSHRTCVQEVQQELACGSVKAVSASYDRCMNQLSATSCPVLFPNDAQGQPTLELPADCMSVVLTRTVDDELALPDLAGARVWQ